MFITFRPYNFKTQDEMTTATKTPRNRKVLAAKKL